jgi:DNA-binding NtrC family response regulator
LLEDGSYRRIGDTQEQLCEARIVSWTNVNLTELVEDGRFWADLYYRLNGIELHIPPLRARREDIVPIAEHYLVQFARSAGHRVPALAPAAISVMEDHHWPGNVWELRHRLSPAIWPLPHEGGKSLSAPKPTSPEAGRQSARQSAARSSYHAVTPHVRIAL